jgi:hypothetical protein
MAAIEVESVEDDSPAKNPEDSGHISWNNNQTRMLIAHFKDNPILWDKQLKDNANRQKTKKAMAPDSSFQYNWSFVINHHHKNNKQFSLSIQIIPVKSSSTSTATDGCHLDFPCARTQRILVVVSDWLNF